MNNPIVIKLKPSAHRGKEVIFLEFEYNHELIDIAKGAGGRWSQSNKRWYVVREQETEKRLEQCFGQKAVLDFSMLRNEQPGGQPLHAENIKEEIIRKNPVREESIDRGYIRSHDRVKIFIINETFMEIFFPFNKTVIQRIKQIPYARWEAARNCWVLPYHDNLIQTIKNTFSDFGYTPVFQKVKTEKKEVKKRDYDIIRQCPPEYLEKLKVKRYSKSTVSTYTSMFTDFINYYHLKALDEISEQDIKDYLIYLIEQRGVSSSYQNQAVNAIKFYYEKVKGGERMVYMIDRPRGEHKLPVVLSFDEVKRILAATVNLKHRCVLMTLYSAGLRISELLNLKINDLDYDHMKIHVRGAKGNKDRFTILSGKLVEMLRDYFSAYKPTNYLFEGAGGKPYSDTSVESIFHKACKYAGITKDVSLHTLRHSFATHMLEKGADVRYIQYLLGHASAKTTQIYTHITAKGMDKIRSPLDDMNF